MHAGARDSFASAMNGLVAYMVENNYCIVFKKNSHYAHCALVVRARYVFLLCVFIVRFRCACCALCVKLLCARCAHSLCAAVVHNVNPDLLRNEPAQCKTVVRSAWHNGLATVSEAIAAWHNGFGIVRILFDGIVFSYNTADEFEDADLF